MADLSRFVTAQEGVFERALAELKAGRKTSHWMWFIFPQLASLGRSAIALRYGIADLAEARAYLAHPILGPRLIAAAEAVVGHERRGAEDILGPIDALKLRSSATLFRAAGAGAAMQPIIDRYYTGQPCPLTLMELAREDDRGPAR